MKIRSDFVSNSSASSFVVAVNATYPISAFAKDIAANSAKDKDLKNENKNILEFCLNTYELLFLGSWIISSSESLMTKDKTREIHGDKYWEFEWKSMIEAVDDRNKRGETAANGKADYVDDNEVIHWFVDNIVEQVAVTKHQMEWDFGTRYQSKEEAYKNLLRFARVHIALENTNEFTYSPTPDIYQITKNTIQNTRLLLENHANVKFDKWENLDSLEARLDAGEKLFVVRVNYQGDGKDAYAIYAEDNHENVLKNIAAEELYGECL